MADIVSMRQFEFRLGLGRLDLRRCAAHAGRYYHPFSKSTGKKIRWIDNPTGILKIVQSRIYGSLLRPLNFAEDIHGGVRKRSPATNATTHVGQPVVVSLDIGDFFPSVTNGHVFSVWRCSLRYSPRLSSLLTKLTTYEGHLPQGAPTSTALANLALDRADAKIRRLCVEKGLTFSRFVDDVSFGGAEARSIINDVVLILRQAGFRVPHRKMKIMPSSKPQLVTGIQINNRPNLPREKRKRIRAQIHLIKRKKVDPEQLGTIEKSVRGRIANLQSISPGTAKAFHSLLESAIYGNKTR